MATYHLRAKTIGRGKGQNAIAAAAYRSGERLRDERSGSTKHYPDRAGRVQFAGIFAPIDAPAWARDRGMLWNAVERIERRRDATLAREIELSLPHELSDRDRLYLVQDFVRDRFMRRGFVVDVAIHAPDRGGDARNYHAHLLIAERRIGPAGFAPVKDRELGQKATLYGWRADWAQLVNRHLARCGHDARVDHRSLKAQGVRLEATRPLGPAATALQRRGIVTPRAARLHDIQNRNALRQAWRNAAGTLTGPVPRPARQRHGAGEGGDAAGLSTQAIVDRYLGLCHDPLRDLEGWWAEQGRPLGQGRTERPGREAGDHDRQPATGSGKLRVDTLPALRRGVDAQESGWRDRDRVPARPGSGDGRADRLRPLRAEAGAALGAGAVDVDAAAARRATAHAAASVALASLAAVVPERSAPLAARELCSRGPPAAPELREDRGPAAYAGMGSGGVDVDELYELMQVIAREVHGSAAWVSERIEDEFAAKVAAAYKMLPRDQAEAAAKGLQHAKRQAMQAVQDWVAGEIKKRQKAARAAVARGCRRPIAGDRKSSEHVPRG